MEVSLFGLRRLTAGMVIAVPSLFVDLPAFAQSDCGDPPKEVPVYIQEQLKGDADGKAQALSKMLGNAELKGNIDASKTELYEEHKNIDKHQIDMYFLWAACKKIFENDTATSTADKAKMWLEFYRAINAPNASDKPVRNPNALYQYGEVVAEVQGAVISQANGSVTFQAVRTFGKADPTREVEYQDWVLTCPHLPTPPPDRIVGQFNGMVAGERCTIIRKRSS